MTYIIIVFAFLGLLMVLRLLAQLISIANVPHQIVERVPQRKAVMRSVAHLICKAPEEEGNHDRAPKLCHDVEKAETPISEDGDGSCCLCSSRCKQPFTECCTRKDQRQ